MYNDIYAIFAYFRDLFNGIFMLVNFKHTCKILKMSTKRTWLFSYNKMHNDIFIGRNLDSSVEELLSVHCNYISQKYCDIQMINKPHQPMIFCNVFSA